MKGCSKLGKLSNRLDNKKNDENSKNYSKKVDDSKTYFDNTKKYAETYEDPQEILKNAKIASWLKKNGYFNNGDEVSTETAEGSGNGKLFGIDDYKGPDETITRNPWTPGNGPFSSGIRAKIVSCSKWDDLILKVCTARKIDPMLGKITMMLESSGNPDETSWDYAKSLGLMQITPANDEDRAKLKEPEYNMSRFADFCDAKAAMAKANGMEPTIFNVAWFYNGFAPNGKLYATALSEIYKGFGLNPNNSYNVAQGVKAGGGGNSAGGTAGSDGDFGFVSPFLGKAVTVTSEVGERDNPTGGGRQGHKGMDLVVGTTGEPVHASNDGTVSVACRDGVGGGYGNYVDINHGNIKGTTYITRYGHMNSVAVNVGQKVKRGDKVGEMGSTGDSTGPHLHFEVRLNEPYGEYRSARRYMKIPG